jgi:hypothetical protein
MRGHDEAVRARFANWPTYALAQWHGQRMLEEWALGDGTYRSLRFDGYEGEEIVVATSEDDEPARHLLLNLPGTDTARFTDEKKAREHNAHSERDADGSVSILVLDLPVRFETWAEGGYTVAGARLEGRAIGVRTNRPLDGVALELTDDIEPYIDGRNKRIRAMRAERGLDD